MRDTDTSASRTLPPQSTNKKNEKKTAQNFLAIGPAHNRQGCGENCLIITAVKEKIYVYRIVACGLQADINGPTTGPQRFQKRQNRVQTLNCATP